MAIITISREMGTGAYHIAEDVAQKLKYTLVDGKKIASVAGKYGLTPETFQMVDEKPPSYITAEDRKRAASLNTIEQIILDFAKKGNVIIYGRGGQDLLKGCKSLFRVRFVGDFEERVERFAEREWIDPDMASSMIRRSDHQRGGFIHFYFDRDWNDPKGYDVIFNTSRLSHDSMVETIVTAAKDTAFKDSEKSGIELIENMSLTKRIETALLNATEIDYRPFSIICDKGSVTISGYISSDDEKSSAIGIVKNLKGVKSLSEDIQVINYKAYKDRN